ncbi:MAG TPA: hypothetical protein VOB72_11750 [Candidatus Dormibacteraeota bacterium]|nr:hypothetical protein [Candidatus Dormibacteraeota bacterium]
MGPDTRALDPRTVYRFTVRLTLGTVSPVAAPSGLGDAAAAVRRAATGLALRSSAVADSLVRLSERGWRTVDVAPSGRDVLAPQGFALPDGSALPESVGAAREATPPEVAADLANVGGDLGAELAAGVTARVDGLDIPVRLADGAAELRYSPLEYLETFSIRG